MNKNIKLTVTGLAFLALGFGLGPLLGGEQEQQENLDPPKPREQTGLGIEQLSELNGAEIPEELQVTEQYLTNRWGHLGEVPQVATGTTAEGEQWVRNKRVIVGRTGDGKQIYAHSYAMAHRFRGQLFNQGNQPEFQGSQLALEGWEPTGSGLSRQTLDLDQLEGSGPGQFAGPGGNYGGRGQGGGAQDDR